MNIHHRIWFTQVYLVPIWMMLVRQVMDILENFADNLRVILGGTFADLEGAEAHHGGDGLGVSGGEEGASQRHVP